jgi:hypothetical protein
MILQA